MHKKETQADKYAPSERPVLPIILAVISAALLLLAVTIPLWVGPTLRFLLPDRYIVAYIPEQLHPLIFNANPSETLPTANPSDTDTALLEQYYESAIFDENVGEGAGDNPTAAPSTPTSLDPASGPAFVPAISSDEGAAPTEILLDGFTHEYQGWNNCGPATVSMLLSHWGFDIDQFNAAAVLKPNPEDKNVNPEEIASYIQSFGMSASIRVNGDINILRQIIAAGYPVIVETGFNPEPDDTGWMGHYQLLVGYTDSTRVFSVMDAYSGPGTEIDYDTLDMFWRHFNRVYVVAYSTGDQPSIEAIIGSEENASEMYSGAAQTARIEIEQFPDDPFGWFNLGSSLVGLGAFDEAALAFDLARSRGLPWRMLWYQFSPLIAYLNTKDARLTDVIALTDHILEYNEYSEEAYYYKGMALLLQEQDRDAANQFQHALDLNPNYLDAQEALSSVSP
nr:C39 family peptidase [Anaerolineae bacterium]